MCVGGVNGTGVFYHRSLLLARIACMQILSRLLLFPFSTATCNVLQWQAVSSCTKCPIASKRHKKVFSSAPAESKTRSITTTVFLEEA